MESVQEVLTLTEAARYIRVSQKTLREMARHQRIPGQKVGREWRFLRDALRSWLSDSSAVLADGVGYDDSAKVSEPLLQYRIPFAGFRDTAFRDNHERAMHRWVPWIAGFSSSFVEDALRKLQYRRPQDVLVLDPFAGVGTTLIEALKKGHRAVGFEINPYAALACQVKTQAPEYDLGLLRERIANFRVFISSTVDGSQNVPKSVPPEGFRSRVRFFSPRVERQVLFSLDFIKAESVPWLRDLFRAALGAVMVGFSNYSYEPSLGTRRAAGKADIEDADVAETVAVKLDEMAEDISLFQARIAEFEPPPTAHVYQRSFFDAEEFLSPGSVDILVTSPPYLNNYHYVRNTRPQMFWLDMVNVSGDLKVLETDSFGQFWQTVRSGPQVKLEIQNGDLECQIDLLRRRNSERGIYGGNGWANYACTYFNDCARFCRMARKLLKSGGTMLVVIGNNILQGIEFKTDVLFAEIAKEEGLRVVDIHEVRSKRTGTSIVNSSVRAGVTKKRTHLYESAVELQAP